MMDTDIKQEYYAAINTREGFLSFFEDIFYSKKIERRYVIKGGPGTGKSSLMRTIATKAENMGKRVEYYFCSSDTTSLDGIVIDGRIAFLDGTSPHTCDTVMPGVVDEIVDLGKFWRTEDLESHRREIIQYQNAKKDAYGRAYKYLRAAGAVLDIRLDAVSSCMDSQKLEAALQRICARERGHTNVSYRATVKQTSAFGTFGSVHLNTLESAAKSKHAVRDYYGSATVFLDGLWRCAERMGIKTYISLNTVDPRHVNEIYFCDSGAYFYACEEVHDRDTDVTVNMKRFIDNASLADQRQALRALRGTYDVLLSLASESLAQAGRAHEKMERIYIEAMNFGGVAELGKELWSKIT